MSVIVSRLEQIRDAIYRLASPTSEVIPWQGTQHTPNSDRTLATTRDRLTIGGTINGVSVGILSGSGQVHIRVVLEDENQREKMTLCRGYIYPGKEIIGLGAVPFRPGDGLRLESRGTQSGIVLLPRGQISRDVYISGGWHATDVGSVDGPGALILNVSEVLNDTDVTISVPTGARARPISFYVEYTATSTAGTRLIAMNLRDSANDIIYEATEQTLTASQSGRAMYAPGIGSQVVVGGSGAPSSVNSSLHTSIPPWQLPASYNLRVFDRSGTAEGFDDMDLQLLWEEWIDSTL